MNMLLMALQLVLLTGEGAADTGMLDKLIGMVPKAFNLVGTIMSSIVSVDLFAFLIAISLLGAGIGIFVKIKHAASR